MSGWLIAAIAFVLVSAPAPSYRAEIEKYRKERLAELTAPNGWLAVQGLYWLLEGAIAAMAR